MSEYVCDNFDLNAPEEAAILFWKKTKIDCVIFRISTSIGAYCFLKLERDYIRCVIQQGLLLNQVLQWGTVTYF